MKKRRLVVLGLSLLGMIIILYAYFSPILKNHSSLQNSEYKVIKTVKATGKPNVDIFGNHNAYILTKNDILINNRYLLRTSYQEIQREKGHSDRHLTNFVYYDLDNHLNARTVNVLKKVHGININAWVYNIYPNGILGENYKNTVGVAYSTTSYIDKDSKILYYNLDTGHYYTPTDSDRVSEDNLYDRPALFYTNLTDKISALGYNYDNISRSISGPNDLHRDVHANRDINLYVSYPNLKKKLTSQGYTLYLRYDKLSKEEIFDTLLRWFAPKGQDTLSGVKIKSVYSIDGQEHEVHSYAEFMQYYNGKELA